jgi:hypothetical protein
VADVAAELGVPTKILRAIEWERRDLLARTPNADLIERQYAALLDRQRVASPAAQATATAPASAARRPRAVWTTLLAVGLTLVIAVVYVVQDMLASGSGDLPTRDLRLLTLVLLVLSSLLLIGAVLPPGVVARGPVPQPTFDRYRQRLALAAIGILAPVTVVALLIALA